MLIVSVLSILFLVAKIGLVEFINNPNRDMLFELMRIKYLNSHMVFNLFLNVSLAFGLYTLLKCDVSIVARLLLGLAACFVFFALMLSEGRAGFFTGLLQLFFFVFYVVWKYFRKILIPTSLLLISLVGFALHHHERIGGVNIMEDAREVIWGVCFDMIKERPLCGYGVSEARQMMVERGINDEDYNKRYYQSFLTIYDYKDRFKMHPHNVFIEAEMEFGIIGLLLLLFIFLYPMIACPHERRLGVFAFVFVIFVQAMFETFGPSIQPICITLGMLLFLEGGIGEPAPQQSHGLQKQAKDIS